MLHEQTLYGGYLTVKGVRKIQCDKLHHPLYIHVTVHRNRFLFKQPTRRTNYPNLFCCKTLHVSAIFSARHQEFSTLRSAMVSFMQVFDDRFQAE